MILKLELKLKLPWVGSTYAAGCCVGHIRQLCTVTNHT